MTKKTSLLIIYILIAVIALAVIVCAFVQVNYLPQIEKPLKITIEDVADSNKQAFYNTTSESFNETDYNGFMNKFNEAFNQSVLGAVFSGKIGNQQTISERSSIGFSESTGYKITFGYADYKNIILNGEVYKNPSFTTQDVQYKELQFLITEAQGFNNIRIYFIDDSEVTTYYYMLTTIANTQSLYEFITELDNFKTA